MGDLGPQERGFLEPPPDEMKLYEQFNSMDLKVLTRDSVKYVYMCVCMCSVCMGAWVLYLCVGWMGVIKIPVSLKVMCLLVSYLDWATGPNDV